MAKGKEEKDERVPPRGEVPDDEQPIEPPEDGGGGGGDIGALIIVFAESGKYIEIRVGNAVIQIPVTAALYAKYRDLFYRYSPSQAQREKWFALKNMMAAAYLKGFSDGLNQDDE